MINYPNTFPFPNEIINGWNARLKGSELKVLLVIVRKTLGWILDPETGMRKEEDYISYSQLKMFTGLTTQPLSSAINSLVNYGLIQVRNKKGELLNTAEKRKCAGRRRDKFIYRLNLTVLKSKVDCFENQSSTVLKSKSNKKKLLQNKLLQKNKSKKYSSLKDITEKDIQEIANGYDVKVSFVRLQLEKLTNYCEAKGKRYKNYKSALRNFVLGSSGNGVKRFHKEEPHPKTEIPNKPISSGRWDELREKAYKKIGRLDKINK